MSLSNYEVAIWSKFYDDHGNCLNCGSYFYAPCTKECKSGHTHEGRTTATICGDCLRNDCGCLTAKQTRVICFTPKQDERK